MSCDINRTDIFLLYTVHQKLSIFNFSFPFQVCFFVHQLKKLRDWVHTYFIINIIIGYKILVIGRNNRTTSRYNFFSGIFFCQIRTTTFSYPNTISNFPISSFFNRLNSIKFYIIIIINNFRSNSNWVLVIFTQNYFN